MVIERSVLLGWTHKTKEETTNSGLQQHGLTVQDTLDREMWRLTINWDWVNPGQTGQFFSMMTNRLVHSVHYLQGYFLKIENGDAKVILLTWRLYLLGKKLFQVTPCRVVESDVSVARAAILHQVTEDWTLQSQFLFCSPESAFSGACQTEDIKWVTLRFLPGAPWVSGRW